MSSVSQHAEVAKALHARIVMIESLEKTQTLTPESLDSVFKLVEIMHPANEL